MAIGLVSMADSLSLVRGLLGFSLVRRMDSTALHPVGNTWKTLAEWHNYVWWNTCVI